VPEPKLGGQKLTPDEILQKVIAANPAFKAIPNPMVMYASPERTAAQTKMMQEGGYGDGPGHLEYWPREETGTPDHPHPTGGQNTVLEIFSDELKNNPELLERAIRGDMLHGMKADPHFNGLREQFKAAYTPETIEWLKSKATAGGDAAGGETSDATHDAFHRGWINPDDRDEWRQHHQATGTLYSPEQLKVLEQMDNYIKTGSAPLPAKRLGGEPLK
jgi:hypothetical protein